MITLSKQTSKEVILFGPTPTEVRQLVGLGGKAGFSDLAGGADVSFPPALHQKALDLVTRTNRPTMKSAVIQPDKYKVG